MEDVIVVGAGPAGAVAAKRCAEYGLDTLILEKRRLPREKVCSGVVVGPVAQTLIRQEFGDIPETVLSQPNHLDGSMFHVPGVGSQKLDHRGPLSWRRNLDYWMNQKAQAKGVKIWQGARVVGLKQKGQGFSVEVEKEKERHEVEAKFVIGADGATSVVRRFLFPELEVRYGQIYQEWYQGELDLDKRYLHWFYPVEYSPTFFTVEQKDNLIVVDVDGRSVLLKQLMAWAKNFLAKNHHFDISQRPVWRGGCVEPIIYRGLVSHTFLPAKGNALLVGDAAGFLFPVTGEGIGTGIKSGLLAASSIITAIESGEQPDKIYLREIEVIISALGGILPWFKRIRDATSVGGRSLPEALAGAFRDALRMF